MSCGSNGLPVLLDIGDDKNLWHGARALFAHVFYRPSKIAGKANLIGFTYALVAKKHHAVVEESRSPAQPDRGEEAG